MWSFTAASCLSDKARRCCPDALDLSWEYDGKLKLSVVASSCVVCRTRRLLRLVPSGLTSAAAAWPVLDESASFATAAALDVLRVASSAGFLPARAFLVAPAVGSEAAARALLPLELSFVEALLARGVLVKGFADSDVASDTPLASAVLL